MAKQPKPRFTETKTSVGAAIDAACEDLTGLGGELEEWHGNLPDSLQSSDLGTKLEEGAGTLNDISAPDVPAFLNDLQVTTTTSLPKRKGRGLSRATRCDDATGALSACIDAVQQWMDDHEVPDADAEADEAEAPSDTGPAEEKEEPATQAQHDEAQELMDALEEIKDNAEGVEFPTMYG